ncbi:MAG: endolytic transglycosylase MltG [Nocardiopsaceae bacterium]|jgi:UPF0755 protein|nr:endolytic transglycosylase MltG [Nocardiopsaceae bacterium]
MARKGGRSRGRRHGPDAGEYDDQRYDDQSGYNGHGDPYQDQGSGWHDAQNGNGWSGGYGQPEGYGGSDPYGAHGYGDQHGYGEQGGYGDPLSYGGQGGYGAGGYGDQGGYAAPGSYGARGGYSDQGDFGDQGGYGGSGYDQPGYGESGYAGADEYGDPGGYGGGHARRGRHSAGPASTPGLGPGHDPYGGSDYGSGDPYGQGSPGSDTGSHGSWAFTRGASGYGQDDHGYDSAADSGSFGRPDSGAFGRPDTGAFDFADSGSFGRADSGRIRRIDGGSFYGDDEFDADRDRDPGSDTGNIRWTSGPPPLRGSSDSDLASPSDDEDGLLSRRFGQGGGGVVEADFRRGRKRRGRKRGKAASSVAIIAVMLVIVAGGIFGFRFAYGWWQNRYGDYTGSGSGVVTITVNPGDTLATLGPELVKKGVIKTLRPYDTAAAAVSKPLLPGVYKMHRHMNSALAVQLLLSSKARTETKVTIIEGSRASTIAAQLAKVTGIKESVFQAIIDKPPADLGIPTWAPKGISAEGFLFPDTYNFQPHETALNILKAMVQDFNQHAASIHLAAAAAHVYTTPYHALVVASMVQAEGGGQPPDFRGISRVVWNRIKNHMPLQFDSTVFYAMGKHGTRLTLQQTKFNSPYNTYQHTGLPPGPIGNPGVDAMQAAVHPANANYLYFITDTRKKPYITHFTDSLPQFNKWKQEFQG